MSPLRFGLFAVCMGVSSMGWAQSKGEFRGERGVIRVQGFSSTSVDVVSGEVILTGGAGPVSVEDTGSGMTLTGRAMTCVLHKSDAGIYTIDRADVTKEGKVVMDSKIAQASEIARLKKEGKPLPAPAKVATLTTLVSEVITYRVVEGESVLTFPSALTIDSHSAGTFTRKSKTQTAEIPFTQQSSLKGTQGRVTFVLDQSTPRKVEVQPRRFHVEGPVRFAVTREETPPGIDGAAPVKQVQNFEATGATFDGDYDASPDPTITLGGNVEASGNGTGFDGKINCDVATVILDTQSFGEFVVKKYQFTGDPAKSQIHIPPTAKKAGGSR